MGIMTAELLELGSCFELVSSPEGKDRKVAALKHGFVHLRGDSVTPASRRRAISAEPRPIFEAEELAFERYVATFHFCRTAEPVSSIASPLSGAKTPTGARRALVEFAMPSAAVDGSSCGGDDAEASTRGPSTSVSPTATAAAFLPCSASVVEGGEASMEDTSSSLSPAAGATPAVPIASSSSPTSELPTEETDTEVVNITRSSELTLPLRDTSPDAKLIVEPVESPSRMRKEAPVFVPGNFGVQPPAASQSPVRRGPLSTMPPSSPSSSFEAGARVPPPPPTAPPRVVSPATPPGAFHSPPRGMAGASTISPFPQAFPSTVGRAPSSPMKAERVPIPTKTAPKLTRALLRGSVNDKRNQAASVEDHSEYASLASHDSSTTAPSSVEEEATGPATSEEVERGGAASQRLSAIRSHFLQGRAGPRERAGGAGAARHMDWADISDEPCSSPRKKSSTGGGSPSNSRNLVWRPKKRSSPVA